MRRGKLTQGRVSNVMERRIHPRVKVSHPVLYSQHFNSTLKAAQTLEISLGGTRIETPYSLTGGEGLEISIAIHPHVIRCRGAVVHTSWLDGERLKAGVRFENLSREDRLYLREYIFYVMDQRDSASLGL